MKAGIHLFACLICSISLLGQHTFSIAAIDPLTNEIGSAGATCLDNVILNGEEGALVVSDIILGRGVIHTQAWWTIVNQNAARQRMEAGDTPEEIMSWLQANDNPAEGGNINDRQYGIVGFVGDEIQTTAFTGSSNFSVAGHRTGANYAIQGNILISEDILDDMEDAFLNTSGSLATRLMAAMQAAKVPGADQRCLSDNVSSLSAFLRVASPEDTNSDYGNLSIDINIGATPDGVDPIDELQAALDMVVSNDPYLSPVSPTIRVFPNPIIGNALQLEAEDAMIKKVRIINLLGEVIEVFNPSSTNQLSISTSALIPDVYMLEVTTEDGIVKMEKVVVPGN